MFLRGSLQFLILSASNYLLQSQPFCIDVPSSLHLAVLADTSSHGCQIPGGDPLIKLLAVDWLKSEKRIDHIAKQSNCCVQVRQPFLFFRVSRIFSCQGYLEVSPYQVMFKRAGIERDF